MTENIGKAIGDQVGTFIKMDMNSLGGGWKSFMRIRVLLDVTKPLKRRIKLRKTGGDWFWADFRYERLPNFCFICGILGHTDRFCHRVFDEDFSMEAEKPFGAWLRAASRRNQAAMGHRWLITDNNRRSTMENNVQHGMSTIGTTRGTETLNASRVRRQDVQIPVNRDVGGISRLTESVDVAMDGAEKTNDVGLGPNKCGLGLTTEDVIMMDPSRKRPANIYEELGDEKIRNEISVGPKNMYMAGSAVQTRPEL